MTASFTITDKAAKQLKKLLPPSPAGLRVSVKGGGCSGLSYSLDVVEAPTSSDKIVENDGARVFIDAKSYLYLRGSQLDYEETLFTSGFKIQNPNVKSECGCGESFSI